MMGRSNRQRKQKTKFEGEARGDAYTLEFDKIVTQNDKASQCIPKSLIRFAGVYFFSHMYTIYFYLILCRNGHVCILMKSYFGCFSQCLDTL